MGVRPQVVIVGAGFGGLAAARGLAKAPVEVTLVDRENFTTFQPLLYQVATSGLNAADVAHPVRGLFHKQANVAFRKGTVTGVDWDRRRVVLTDDTDEPGGPGSLPFDHLIVAAGAVNTWYGVPGAHEHALPLYTLEDAIAVRNHVVERFETADAANAGGDGAKPHPHPGELTFVVVGGGPTGVEMAGALAELFAVVFRRDYPRLDVARARVVLVETRDELLGAFHPASQRHAAATLGARGVEVRLGETVDEVTPDHVRFASGEVLATQTVIWAAGVRANPLAEALGLETTGNGRIVVGPDLAVPGRPGVWAVGDVAAALQGSRMGHGCFLGGSRRREVERRGISAHGAFGAGPLGTWSRRGRDVLPQLAPVAMQSGGHVARQIARLGEGKPAQPFKFVDKGTMATIGRRAAITELPGGVRLHGTLAWLAWLGLHILYLAGVRNRASVLLNWAWGYLTWDRGPRIILRTEAEATAEARAGTTAT